MAQMTTTETLVAMVRLDRGHIQQELRALCFECCGEPHQYFDEGSEQSMGYPVLTEEQCCGRVRPLVPQNVIDYIENLTERK